MQIISNRELKCSSSCQACFLTIFKIWIMVCYKIPQTNILKNTSFFIWKRGEGVKNNNKNQLIRAVNSTEQDCWIILTNVVGDPLCATAWRSMWHIGNEWKVITTTWISAVSCWSFFTLQCDGEGRMSTLTISWVIFLLRGAQVMSWKLQVMN